MRRAWLAITIVAFAAALLWVWQQRNDAARGQDLGLSAGVVNGREARISLRAVADAGPIVTLVGEINYDAARLRMQSCSSEAAKGGKTLQVKEPIPGTVRAVLAGTLEPLPPSSDVVTCTFAITGQGSGTTVVRAHGEVADTTYVDRPFVLEQTVRVGS